MRTKTPTPQRQPILTAYQKKAGRAVDGYFRKIARPGRPSGVRAHRGEGVTRQKLS